MSAPHSGSIGRGILAGLTATVAVSLLILLQQALRFMPDVNLVMTLARALGHRSAMAGWTAHLAIGVLAWGTLFAWFDRHVSFPHWVNGLLFGSVVWLGVMLVIMPAAGQGLFGARLAFGAPTVALFLHWVYGAVLGGVYGWLQPPDRESVPHRWQGMWPYRG